MDAVKDLGGAGVSLDHSYDFRIREVAGVHLVEDGPAVVGDAVGR